MRGGPRPGAGRPPEPRLTAADTRTLLDALRLPGESWAALAARLGVARQAVHRALKVGATVRTLRAWGATSP